MSFVGATKHFIKNNYKDFLKGIILGAVMMVPGISGGTMAIVLGLYAKIIFSINNLFKKQSLIFLAVTGFGAVLGVLVLSSVIAVAIKNYPTITTWFFAGIVLGSFPLMIKEAQFTKSLVSKTKQLPTLILLFVLGALFVFSLSRMQGRLIDLSEAKGFLAVVINFAAGLLTAATLVLPGISGSLFLISIGLYATLIKSLKFVSPNLLFLIPFFCALVIGVFLTSKFVASIFEKYRTFAFIAICGFLAGTVITMLLGAPLVKSQAFCAIMLFVLGLGVTLSLFYLTKNDCNFSLKQCGTPQELEPQDKI